MRELRLQSQYALFFFFGEGMKMRNRMRLWNSIYKMPKFLDQPFGTDQKRAGYFFKVKVRFASQAFLAIGLSFLSTNGALAEAKIHPHEGNCYFVIASEETLYETNKLLDDLPMELRNSVRVFRSANNWLAITLGEVPNDEFQSQKSDYIQRFSIANDTICSNGNLYKNEVSIWSVEHSSILDQLPPPNSVRPYWPLYWPFEDQLTRSEPFAYSNTFVSLYPNHDEIYDGVAFGDGYTVQVDSEPNCNGAHACSVSAYSRYPANSSFEDIYKASLEEASAYNELKGIDDYSPQLVDLANGQKAIFEEGKCYAYCQMGRLIFVEDGYVNIVSSKLLSSDPDSIQTATRSAESIWRYK